MKLLQNLPAPVKIALLVGVIGVIILIGALARDHPLLVVIVLLAGAVLAIAGLYLHRWIERRREKRQGDAFGEGIKQGARRAPQGVTADSRARLDDLSKMFESGIQTYRSAGKNVYSLPWFLLAGPPGSGKTEAMRHSSIGFPPGLHDPLQGTGGTLSMNWWFTNNAVVLDTAGRLLMSEGSSPTDNSEWKEFLKLLKRARGRCPINGLLLAVDVETLLKDSSEQIEKKAGLIARQLDVIQRVLDVRFPVFVLVTKCDRIVGFREFFESMTDPQAAQQILGWSNPAGLDEPFSSDAVEQHLGVVREALVKRRRFLLLDPVHTDDASARRTDQVDAMFAFPDRLQAMGSRLKRFLELVFVAGEWSPKPLFLRGIYFTSSLQEGRALDEALAKAMGMSLESLPDDVPRKDKSFFLRDVFTGKVFREKGLVTSAANVSKAQRARRVALVTAGIAFAAALIGLSFLGAWDLRTRVSAPSKGWKRLAADYQRVEQPRALTSANPLALVMRDSVKGDTLYAGAEPLDPADTDRTRASLPLESRKLQGEMSPGLIFRPLTFLMGDTNTLAPERRAAHRALLESATLAPLVTSVRAELARPQAWGLAAVGTPATGAFAPERFDSAVKALAELIRLDTFAQGGEPAKDAAPGRPLVALTPLIDVLEQRKPGEEPKNRLERAEQISLLETAITEAYADAAGGSDWPPRAVGSEGGASRLELKAALANFAAAAQQGGGSGPFAALTDLMTALKDFKAVDARGLAWPTDAAGGERTLVAFDAALVKWKALAAELRAAGDRAAAALARLGKAPIDERMLADAESQERTRLEALFASLTTALPPPPSAGLLDAIGDEAGKAAARKADDKAKSSPLGAAAKRLAGKAAGKPGEEIDLAQDLRLAKDAALTSIKTRADVFRQALRDGGTTELLEVRRDTRRLTNRLTLLGAVETELDKSAKVDAIFKPSEDSLRIKIDEADAAGRDTLARAADDDLGMQGELTARRGIERALRAARAALVSRLIDRYADPQTFAGTTAFAERVRALAKNDTLEAPRLPMVRGAGDAALDASKNPGAAKLVFDDYDAARKEVMKPAEALERPLDQAKRRDNVERVRTLMGDYASDYFRYWSEGARVHWNAGGVVTWDAFVAELAKVSTSGNSDTVADFLEKRVLPALRAIPASRPGTLGAEAAADGGLITAETLRKAVERIETEITVLRNPATRSPQSATLESWRALPTSGAAAALAEMLTQANSPAALQQKYLGLPAGTSQDQRPSEYWMGVWIQGLKLLTDGRRAEAAREQGELAPLLGMFPLNLDDPRTLTKAQMERAAKLAQNAAPRRLPGPLQSGASVKEETMQEINRELQQTGASTAPGAALQAERMRQLAEHLAAPEGIPMTFTILSTKPGAVPGASDNGLAIYVYQYARVVINDRPVDVEGVPGFRLINFLAEKPDRFGASLGKDSIRVELAKNVNTVAPELVFDLPAPWSLLEGLRGSEHGLSAPTGEGGAQEWYFLLKSKDGTQRLWLKARENKVPPLLPPYADWPRSR
ncbi:hypothetical protein BH11PLA1_BH11PLA1_17780 [soil metagenome]